MDKFEEKARKVYMEDFSHFSGVNPKIDLLASALRSARRQGKIEGLEEAATAAYHGMTTGVVSKKKLRAGAAALRAEGEKADG